MAKKSKKIKTISKCPICDNSDTRTFRKSFLPKLIECTKCSGHFIKNPKQVTYSQEYFQDNSKDSLPSLLFKPILNFFYNQRMQKISNIVDKPKDSILDYGCGSGKLVKLLIENGFKAEGYEPSSGGRNLAKKEKLPVFPKLPSNKKYNLVMFWHSLEHINDPLKTIETIIKKNLKRNGKILIAVPNADSLEAKITKTKWFHYSYPLHNIQFTPKSLKHMLKKTDFKTKNIDFLNVEYTLSGLVQSFLNLLLPQDVLYSQIAHRRKNLSSLESFFYTLLSLGLITLFSPFLLIFFTYQLILKKTGAIVVVAWKS